MRISDFEYYISDIIVERGEGYYMDGNYKLMHRNGNQVVYQVFGTNAYTTKIDLIGDLIASTSCDCPYDQGPVCKHIVTVLYDLREIQIDENKSDISDVEQLIKNLPDSVVREEFLSLLNAKAEYQQKLLLKYGQVKAENINELVINAFYAAEIECDKFGFCELSDFSGILEDILRNLEKKHSLPEMILFVKEITKEVENIFEREYGHTAGLYENDTFYLTEFADTYFDEYSSKKSVNGIKDIVDSYAQDFYEEVDYHNSSIPTHVLFTLERLNYAEIAKNKIKNIILDIKNNAKKYLSYSISDFLFIPSEELVEYKEKALNQNSILLSLDHYLYHQAVNNDNDDQIEKIMNRDFLLDFYFYKQKIFSLIAAKKYKEVELLLMGDFNNYMYSSQVESLKEDLYKRTNRSDELREMYRTELKRRFTMNTYLHFKELSNEVEFKRLLREIVDKYLGDRYVPKDLIHILIMEELDKLIIKLISNYTPLVSEYYDLLSDKYETELNEIYQSYIYAFAKTANKRSHYKKVCNEIKRYRSLTGIDVDPIVEELKVLYKKRRAMIEELDKVSSKSKFVQRTIIHF